MGLQYQMSGVDLDGRQIRKGAPDSMYGCTSYFQVNITPQSLPKLLAAPLPCATAISRVLFAVNSEKTAE